jgi:hypothetical protein
MREIVGGSLTAALPFPDKSCRDVDGRGEGARDGVLITFSSKVSSDSAFPPCINRMRFEARPTGRDLRISVLRVDVVAWRETGIERSKSGSEAENRIVRSRVGA